MNWANYILLAIYAISFGINLEAHGKPKEGNYNKGTPYKIS